MEGVVVMGGRFHPFVCCMLALPLLAGGCHDGDIEIEELLARGLTANQIELLIKQIRGRVLGEGSATILALVVSDLDELIDLDPDVDGVNDDGSGPDIVVSGSPEVVSGGTFRVTVESAPADGIGPERNAFNYVFVTVGDGVDSPGGPEGTYVVKIDVDPSTPELEPVTRVELFITVPADIPFQDVVCTYQAGLLAGGLLNIGAVDEDSRSETKIKQVCSGDLQVTLTWDSPSDLDLRVLDPNGNEARLGGPDTSPPFVASAGQRGGGNCEAEGLLFESLCWGADEPFELDPPLVGEYSARVLNSSSCEPTEFTLTIFVGNELQQAIEGVLSRDGEESDPLAFQFPFRADLGVTKTVSPLTAELLDQVTWTIEVENVDLHLANDATGVQVTDVLPEGLLFLGADSEEFDVESGIWTVGDLPKGESAVLELVTQVALDAPLAITNTARAIGDQVDKSSGNDAGSATLSVQNTTVADLAVTLTIEPASVLPGDTVRLTAVVEHRGGAPVTGAVVSVFVSSELEQVEVVEGTGFDADTSDWNLASLAAGQTVRLVLEAEVGGGVFSGATLANTVQLTDIGSLELDSNGDNNSDEADAVVADFADLALSKIVDEQNPEEGETVLFTLFATNATGEVGPTATHVVVEEILPAGLTYVAHDLGDYDPVSGVWSIGDLGPGGSATLLLQASVACGAAGESFQNHAKISSDLPDPVAGNNEASVTLTAVGASPVAPVLSDGSGNLVCNDCSCIGFDGNPFDGCSYRFEFAYADCNGDVSQPMANSMDVVMDWEFRVNGDPLSSGIWDISGFTPRIGDGFNGILRPNPCWDSVPGAADELVVTFRVTDDGGQSSQITISVDL